MISSIVLAAFISSQTVYKPVEFKINEERIPEKRMQIENPYGPRTIYIGKTPSVPFLVTGLMMQFGMMMYRLDSIAVGLNHGVAGCCLRIYYRDPDRIHIVWDFDDTLILTGFDKKQYEEAMNEIILYIKRYIKMNE